jgi:hypothetical protein
MYGLPEEEESGIVCSSPITNEGECGLYLGSVFDALMHLSSSSSRKKRRKKDNKKK